MKRWLLLILSGLLVLGVFAVGATGALYLQERKGAPPFRLGRVLGKLHYPGWLAIPLCTTLGPREPLCLRGYYRARLSGPLSGNPAQPCQGLPPGPARACSEVQGLRLVEWGISRPLVVCAQLPDPLACARYVGRAAFTRGGFAAGGERSAKALCAQGKGEYLAHCRVGASMEAVERHGRRILAAAEEFCRDYGENLCYAGLVSALKTILPREEALEACSLLSPRGAAWCVRGIRE